MAETGWTKEWHKLPNGVYWWRFDEKETPVAVRVFQSRVFAFAEDEPRWLNTYGGEFLGPLSPADFEQLTRLREEISFAISNGHKWTRKDWATWIKNHAEVALQ